MLGSKQQGLIREHPKSLRHDYERPGVLRHEGELNDHPSDRSRESQIYHLLAGPIIFFSAEKMFTVDSEVNRRNDSWLFHNPKDVPVVGKSKFSDNIHVLSCSRTSSDGRNSHEECLFRDHENGDKAIDGFCGLWKTVLVKGLLVSCQSRTTTCGV